MAHSLDRQDGPAAERQRGWTLAGLWGLVAYAIHKAGALTGLYLQYGWFQNLTHACSASAAVALAAMAGLSLGMRGRRLVVFAVGLTALGAVGWEAVEYLGLLDAYGVWLHFHGFHDAAIDMASNAVGVGATLAVLRSTVGFDGD